MKHLLHYMIIITMLNAPTLHTMTTDTSSSSQLNTDASSMIGTAKAIIMSPGAQQKILKIVTAPGSPVYPGSPLYMTQDSLPRPKSVPLENREPVKISTPTNTPAEKQ